MNPPVGVFFETEHIYTLDNTSEMMLAVLSAAAQEESHTKSEIMNISIEQRFSRGIFLTPELLGYDLDENGQLVINEDEAQTVMLCYYLLLAGKTTSEIAELLTELKRKTKRGNTKWSSSSVIGVLQNERHCGDVLSRKTYTPNYLDHKSKKNRKNRNQYKQKDHHEAIVSREIYNAAQKMLSYYRYRKSGNRLPILQVIEKGALKGFVPVDRNWSGFDSKDYCLASESVYKDQDAILVEKQEYPTKKCFDLSGYEIVRAQFFSTRENPAMTITDGKLNFNTACLRKFENVEYVELLFNTVEKCLAIRPCEKENPNAIRWGCLKDNKWVVLSKSCKAFSQSLFDFMEWESDYKYRMRGNFEAFGDEQVMVFSLDEPEIIKPEILEEEKLEEIEQPEKTEQMEAQLEESKDKKQRVSKKYIWMYPGEWAKGFGEKADQQSFVFLKRAKYCGDWEILRPAVCVEGYQQIEEEDIHKLSQEAAELIMGMRKAV